MSESTKTYLKQVASEVEAVLDRASAGAASVPERVRQAMRYSLLDGGKRLRPALVIAACEACGGTRKHALPTAAALECIHTYSLIHDDLPCMDNDDLRRGRPSCHVQFDVPTALLAGAGLLELAFNLIASSGDAFPELAPRLPAVIIEVGRSAGARGMVGGQVLDMISENREITLEELEQIHLGKTAALLRAAVLSGAIIAGANAERLKSLAQFARHLGLAFQIVDDILDVESTSEELGKPAGSDENNAKSTYPRLLGLDESKVRARAEMERAYESLTKAGAMNTPLEGLARFVLERRN